MGTTIRDLAGRVTALRSSNSTPRSQISIGDVEDSASLQRLLRALHDRVDALETAAQGSVFGSAKVLPDVSFTGGTALEVAHGLGRRALGCIVIAGSALIRFSRQASSDESRFIKITMDLTGTYTLVVV